MTAPLYVTEKSSANPDITFCSHNADILNTIYVYIDAIN